MDDTRFRSSAAAQQASSHPGSGSLTTVTTSFNSIVQTITNPSVLSDTGKSFPVYYDSSAGAIQAMSLTDFLDTFNNESKKFPKSLPSPLEFSI